jgi:hypothetical protein
MFIGPRTAFDREAEHHQWPAIVHPDGARHAVDERQLRDPIRTTENRSATAGAP